MKEMSGTSRAPSFGTPVPACHAGFAMLALAPPPPAAKPVEVAVPEIVISVSFHAPSGIYMSADDTTSVVVAGFQ